jgi:hypothetical protein
MSFYIWAFQALVSVDMREKELLCHDEEFLSLWVCERMVLENSRGKYLFEYSLSYRVLI